jgi:DNA polymerase-4
MERHILHLDMDTFFVSVERLENKALIGKPVIVGGTSDRGVVASCSCRKTVAALPNLLFKQVCTGNKYL